MTASEKLIQKLGLGACDAVAVHNPSNMFYLTEGYTGEGVVYISAKQQVIITDFRYTEQAERQAPKFKVVMVGNGLSHSAWVGKLCKEDGISSLRYEDDYLTVKDFEGLRSAVGEMTYLPLAGAPEVLRQVKTEAEVACIREACAITSKAFSEVVTRIREGMTEKELRIELDFIQLKMGAQGNSFDTIIASGVNGSLCHAVPTDKKLVKGEMITMDFGCKVGGYCSDMTRTVALGEPSPEMRRIYDTVFHAQKICEDAVAPGKNCFDIDKMARDYIDAQGYVGRFGHGLGHAVGIDIHENPRFSTACHDTLVPGIVITVEPGVYVPGLGGVRIENTVLVTENGHEALTTAPKELMIL